MSKTNVTPRTVTGDYAAAIFNSSEQASSLATSTQVAAGLNLSADGLKALTPQALADKLKAIDYSKVSTDKTTQDLVKGGVDQFLKAYQNAVGGLAPIGTEAL
jgi:hypothetical protein